MRHPVPQTVVNIVYNCVCVYDMVYCQDLSETPCSLDLNKYHMCFTWFLVEQLSETSSYPDRGEYRMYHRHGLPSHSSDTSCSSDRGSVCSVWVEL